MKGKFANCKPWSKTWTRNGSSTSLAIRTALESELWSLFPGMKALRKFSG